MDIFKSYDIRGVFPDELDEKTAFLIGQNFVQKTKSKKIVIAQDARLSSPSLFKAISQGIISQNCSLYNIGVAPTELIYFSVSNYDFDGGIMITASHNPKEYNGFKMLEKRKGKIRIISGEEMKDLKKIKAKKKGKIFNFNPYKKYLRHLLSFVDLKNIKGKKIAVDAGNGVAGIILKKLNLDIISLNFKPDGNFPNRSPNPLEEGSLKEIKKKQIDFGFLFDGDADRIFMVNKKGKIINPDICLLSLAERFTSPTIVFNVLGSKVIPEFVEKMGGKTIRSKVGWINIREAMIKNKAVLGGEPSGHYCFKDNDYFDSGFIAFLMLLENICLEKKLPSSPYFKTPEINFEVKKKKELLKEIKKRYKEKKQDFLDGITVYSKNWWFCLRPSQTENLLKLVIEANSKEILYKKEKEISKIIESPYFS